MEIEPNKVVTSLGGPLILINSESFPVWGGIHFNSASKQSPAGGGTDYERACAVERYIGKIEVGGSEAVIFGDMPMPTSPLILKGNLVICRYMYAPVDYDWRDAELDIERRRIEYIDDPVEDPVELDIVGDGIYILLDSANSTTEHYDKSETCVIKFEKKNIRLILMQ